MLVGIGCSITSTAAITLFLLPLLPDDIDGEESKGLEKWGIQHIYKERRDTALVGKVLPKKQLDFIAFGLHHFRNSNKEKNSDLVKRLRKGLNIRIITLHPKSRFVIERQHLEKRDGLSSEIVALEKWKDNMLKYAGASCKGSIEIKYYNNIPLDFYCRADNNFFVGPYMPGGTSGSDITYEFKTKDTEGGKYYPQIFEDLWNGKILNFVELSSYYLIGDQASAIESTLKHFCEELAGSDGGKKICGIVVMFKGQLRRTIFSCNKRTLERYKCYAKDKGTVGEMINLNKTPAEEVEILFEDFENQLSFVSYQSERIEHQRRIDFPKPAADDSNEAIKAILAIPIICNEQLIGAITFDFSDLPNKYKDELKQMRDIELKQDLLAIESNLEVQRWLRLGEACRQIIQPMLGGELKLQYKNLYEEEWKHDSSKAV